MLIVNSQATAVRAAPDHRARRLRVGDRQVSQSPGGRPRNLVRPRRLRRRALYTFRQPGIYAYVNHNLIEAVELGATAHFKVEGEWNNDLMEQVSPPGPIPAAAKLHGALVR